MGTLLNAREQSRGGWDAGDVDISSLAFIKTREGSQARGRSVARSPYAPRTVAARRPLDDRLISLRDPMSFQAERYRLLRHRLEQLRSSAGHSVFGITSAVVGEGKTTTAINLAGSLAQAHGSRTLLVDADLRRPCVSERLGLGDQTGPGLVGAVLESSFELANVVRYRSPYKLALLPAGNGSGHPYEILQSPRVGELLSKARQLYDFVVVDLPPILLVPDCCQMARSVDGLLIVVAAHKTPSKLLEEALDVVEPAKVVGIVFNRDDRLLSGYYNYYRDYQGYRPSRSRDVPWRRLAMSGGAAS